MIYNNMMAVIGAPKIGTLSRNSEHVSRAYSSTDSLEVFIGCIVLAFLIWAALTLTAWCDDQGKYGKNRTLVQTVSSQFVYIKKMMGRIW